ncbi:MAG: ParA family protein, partial [Clostridia bacterium]|nr:ParA family protein [Clostridia bacterium]
IIVNQYGQLTAVSSSMVPHTHTLNEITDFPTEFLQFASEQSFKNIDFSNGKWDLSTVTIGGAIKEFHEELVSIENREFKLKEAFKEVQNDYDYIIIDCPPSLSLLTVNAFAAANSVLIPIQCEYYALEGLSQLTHTIRIVRKGINPELEIEGALLTMFDSRTNLSIEVVEEVKKALPHKVCKTIIPRNVRLSEAPSFGVPVIEHDPHSKGAYCYRELAKEIIKNNKR